MEREDHEHEDLLVVHFQLVLRRAFAAGGREYRQVQRNIPLGKRSPASASGVLGAVRVIYPCALARQPACAGRSAWGIPWQACRQMLEVNEDLRVRSGKIMRVRDTNKNSVTSQYVSPAALRA
jgi:hypothetical protein